LIALSAAFSITMIMTGVARTAGSVESLEAVGEVLRLDDEWKPSFGTNWDLRHVVCPLLTRA